jgi:hypothetical protein
MQRTVGGRPIELTAEVEPLVRELYRRFCKKFGREPTTEDPLFFDPDADSPVPLPPAKLHELWAQLSDAMLSRGDITPEVAYAMKKTGLLATPDARHMLTHQQRHEWDNAMMEYTSCAAQIPHPAPDCYSQSGNCSSANSSARPRTSKALQSRHNHTAISGKRSRVR